VSGSARLAIDEQIRTTTGARVPLTPTTSIASAGPMLLRDGHSAIDAVDEGVLDPRDLNDYTFSAYRHARTLVGIDARGRLILVTADGVAGVSEGLTLTEEAALMRSLRAVNAMNLDGGGSTEFAVNGQLVNDASSTPLRPVGDTIEVVPAPARNH
jgi:exopolysaccharide biosynthesis protein